MLATLMQTRRHERDDMTKKDRDTVQPSERARDYDAMLKAALARPGVREVMEVFGAWQTADLQLQNYRSAATKPEKTATTNSSSAV